MRLRGDDKYFLDEYTVNEDFHKYLEFAKTIIINHRIKKVHFSDKYHYSVYKGEVKAYMSQRKNRNQKSLILKGKNWELECSLYNWKNIEFKKDEIALEDVGLYIVFTKPIQQEYKEFKKLLEEEKQTTEE